MKDKNCGLSFSDRLLLLFTIADLLFDLPLIGKFVHKKLKKRTAELEAEAEEEKQEKEWEKLIFKCSTQAEAAFNSSYEKLLNDNKDKLKKDLEDIESELNKLKENNPDLNKRLNKIAEAIRIS